MKEEILKLRAEGKSYNEIASIVGCSKSTISYYCGNGQKEKNAERQRKNRKKDAFVNKINAFKCKRSFYDRYNLFQRRDGIIYRTKREKNFSFKELKEKIGNNPTCYLTGRPIDISKPKTYHFDHFIPTTKGGDNSLENLRISCKDANLAKSGMLFEEFIALCKEILVFNGHTVTKNNC